MQLNKTTSLLIGCFLLTILSGILRGRIDHRWGMSQEMQSAAERVQQLPTTIGSWSLVSDDGDFRELNDPTVKMLRCAANVVATYQHQPSGQFVNIIFMVGPAGPLAQHTPDVCYVSNNYRVVEARRQALIRDSDGIEHEFAVASFQQNKPGSRPERVYYAWNRRGSWTAPGSPRTSFAGLSMLYKIQVAATLADDAPNSLDLGAEFLRETLPVLQTICN